MSREDQSSVNMSVHFSLSPEDLNDPEVKVFMEKLQTKLGPLMGMMGGGGMPGGMGGFGGMSEEDDGEDLPDLEEADDSAGMPSVEEVD